MKTVSAEPREPKVMFRRMLVCEGCWFERNPGREPVWVVDGASLDCIACETPTYRGAYVRMRLEWP